VKRFIRLAALLMCLTLIAAACGGDDGDGVTDTGEDLQKGGTFVGGMLGDISAAFDPQKEYYSVTWEYYRCCLLRTLLTYPALPGTEGNELVPDIAEDLPEVSEDGLTWTFNLKQGIMYSPPLQDTEVVADDFIRAMERTANPKTNTGGYGFYYSVIEGFDEFGEGKADTISGMTAVDDYTLEITLTDPVGDLGYRMAMPTTAPIPEGVTDGHDKDYGRFLIGTGPYMIEGTDQLDFSAPPGDQKPTSGYKPGKLIVFVRNPSWKAETDEVRKAYIDRFEFPIGGTEEDIANKIDAGEVDLSVDGVPPAQQIRQYQADPNKKDNIHVFQEDVIRYIEMNVAEPPFDDIAVRKAVNWALDKDGMRRVRGGPLFGEIAGHNIVPSLLGGELEGYDPYGSENSQGDIEAAKEEMKNSKYDTDGDGVCDAPECKGVLAVTDEADPYPDQAALIQDNFKPLGITLDVKSFERNTMYDKCLNPDEHTAICLAPAWGKDYPDATTYGEPLFGDTAIYPACCNRSLLGASSDLLKKAGYETTDVPSADDKIAECDETPAGDERFQCWGELDTALMEEHVPWIPYLFSNSVDVVSERVVGYRYDQFAGLMALDQIALQGGGSE